jgi:hypothetical protein
MPIRRDLDARQNGPFPCVFTYALDGRDPASEVVGGPRRFINEKERIK